MALSVEAARQVEHELKTKAEILAYEIGNLVAKDPARARAICSDVVAMLQHSLGAGSDPAGARESASTDRKPSLRIAASRTGADETEEFILDILANSARGTLSVQEIVEYLEEAQIEIKRPTLIVRLHRMVQAGKLSSRTHGHYALSDVEHAVRRPT